MSIEQEVTFTNSQQQQILNIVRKIRQSFEGEDSNLIMYALLIIVADLTISGENPSDVLISVIKQLNDFANGFMERIAEEKIVERFHIEQKNLDN